MGYELYEKVHEEWKDRPDKSTPCMGADLMHFEQGIYDNSANIKELSESGFITKTVEDLTNYYKKSETYTKEEVSELIAEINTMQFSVVSELPTEDISTSTIYLAPAESGKTGNIYNEYLYVNGQWEVIGNTAIDLSGYLTITGDSSATVSIGNLESGDSAETLYDEEDYPVLDISPAEKLRVKFRKISDCFNGLVTTIKSKIPSLTTSLAVNVEGVSALDGTVGKVLNDKITANSDAIDEMNKHKTATITPTNYLDIISFSKKGSFIEMRLGKATKNITAMSTVENIGTAPEAFRPILGEYRVVPATIQAIPVFISIGINGNIAIRISGNISENSQTYILIQYIAK